MVLVAAVICNLLGESGIEWIMGESLLLLTMNINADNRKRQSMCVALRIIALETCGSYGCFMV